MRKWLYLVLVLVIAGLFSGAYYVTGVKAEKEFGLFIKSANNLPNLKVAAENYHRGWLKSTVHIHAILHRPPQQYNTQAGILQTLPAQDVSFSFDMTIYHGPIIFADHHIAFGLGYAEADVPLPDEILNKFNQVFTPNSTKPTFNISLLLRYAGKLDVVVDVPSFTLVSKDNLAKIDWHGLHGHWLVSQKLSHINGRVVFHGMTFKMGDANGSMGSVRMKYDVRNQKKGVLSGKASVGLEKLQVVLGPQSIVVDGFQAVSESNIKNKDSIPLVDSSLSADVSSLTYQGLDYGPGTVDIHLSNLDAEALSQIQQKLQSASNENLTESQQNMFMLTLLPELSRLLSKGAEFQMKQLQLAIPQGLIIATAKIKLPLQVQPNENQNPLQLIQQMRAYVKAEVPMAWLNDRLTDFFQVKIEQRQLMEQQMATNATNNTQTENIASASDENTVSTDEKVTKPLLSLQEMNSLAKQQALEQLRNLVQNGVLIQKEDVYQIKVTYKDGTLYINGKPFNNQQISEGTSNDSAHQ